MRGEEGRVDGRDGHAYIAILSSATERGRKRKEEEEEKRKKEGESDACTASGEDGGVCVCGWGCN